jgi:serine/threonine-protein kinase
VPTQLEQLQESLAATYAVERELGAGGMATVYLARDVKHGRQVAIKVLHPDLSATIGAERFEREIRLAASLQHPHILGLYDSGSTDGLLYYVMPFVEGESLRDRLDREGQLPIDDAIQLILEVADALGYAHKQNIVHRDIKPENILLSGGHALVADFGIARAVDDSGGAKLTQTGMAIGTPVYMSPEQSVGEKVGPTADIYSLGCMLYEMLAGEPPFTGKNAVQIMARHAMEQVPSLRIVRQSVPEEVEEAIFAALEKSPADRPKTCAEFTEILGMPLGATATLRVMNRTSTRRTPTGMTRSYPTGMPQAPEPTPVWKRPWAVALVVLLLVGGAGAGWKLLGGGGAPAVDVGGFPANTIAVLYFDDNSPGKDLGYVADGITEGLIQSLSGVQGLNVISRAGVERFRHDSTPIDSIARTLEAGTLVRGSVVPDGEKLKISLYLVDGNSGADLPDSRAALELPSANALAVRDSVASQVAELIRKRVGTEFKLKEQRSSTRSADAWSLVQRAAQRKRAGEEAAAVGDTLALRGAFLETDSLLGVAEQLDPKWVEPILQRGLVAYRWSRLVGSSISRIESHVKDGLGHVARALELDPTNPDALELRGTLRYFGWTRGLEPDSGKAAALLLDAQADLERSTEINPAQAGSWATLSHLYNQTGTPTDVATAASRALSADAFLENADVILGRLFLADYDLSNYKKAEKWCEDTRRRFPGSFASPRCQLFMMTMKDFTSPDVARALRLADSVVALAPANRKAYYRLNSDLLVAAVMARSGQRDSAQALARRSTGDAEVSPTRDLSMVGAFALAQAGDTTGAIEQLKLYFNANERMRGVYANDPGWWFKGISADPRWQKLVAGK